MSTSEPTSEPPVASQPDYVFTTGLDYTTTQLVEFNNQAFQNYFREMTLTAELAENMFVQLQLHRTYSLYMHDSRTGAYVGMARSAIRGSVVWVAGLAVIPEYRSRGVGKILLQHYLEHLRNAGFRSVQLECIEQNKAALKLYERNGFVSKCKVSRFEVQATEVVVSPEKSFEIVEHEKELDLTLPWLQHTLQYPWMRDWASILMESGLRTMVIRDAEGKVSAALLFTTTRNNVNVQSVAMTERTTKEQIAALVVEAARQTEKRTIVVNLEPQDSAVFPIYIAIGFKTVLDQWQMFLNM